MIVIDRIIPDNNALAFSATAMNEILSSFWVENSGYSRALDALSKANRRLEMHNYVALEELKALEGVDNAPAYHFYDKYPVRVYLSQRDRAPVNRVKVRQSDPMQTGYRQATPYVVDAAPVVGGYLPLEVEVAFPAPSGITSVSAVYTRPSATSGVPCRIEDGSILLPRSADPFMDESGFFTEEFDDDVGATLWLVSVTQDRGFPRRFLSWLSGLQGEVPAELYAGVSACVDLVGRGMTPASLRSFSRALTGAEPTIISTEAELLQAFPDGLPLPAEVTGCVAVTAPWEYQPVDLSDGRIRFTLYTGSEELSNEVWDRIDTFMQLAGVPASDLLPGAEGVEQTPSGYRVSPAAYLYGNMLRNRLIYIRLPDVDNRRKNLSGAWNVLKSVAPTYAVVRPYAAVDVSQVLPIEFFAGNAATYVYNSVQIENELVPEAVSAHTMPKTLCVGRNLHYDVRNTTSPGCRTCG